MEKTGAITRKICSISNCVVVVNWDIRHATTVIKIFGVFMNAYAWFEKKVIRWFRKEPLKLELTVGFK